MASSADDRTKSLLSTRTFGTQTFNEDIANVQVVLNLQCTSEDYQGVTSSSSAKNVAPEVDPTIFCNDMSQAPDLPSAEADENRESKLVDVEETIAISVCNVLEPQDLFSKGSSSLEHGQDAHQKDVSCMVDISKSDSLENTGSPFEVTVGTKQWDPGEYTEALGSKDEQQEIPSSIAKDTKDIMESTCRDEISDTMQTSSAIIVYQSLKMWDPPSWNEVITGECEQERPVATVECMERDATTYLPEVPTTVISHEPALYMELGDHQQDESVQEDIPESKSLIAQKNSNCSTIIDGATTLAHLEMERVKLYLMPDEFGTTIHVAIETDPPVFPLPYDCQASKLVDLQLTSLTDYVFVHLNTLESTDPLMKGIKTCAETTCEGSPATDSIKSTHDNCREPTKDIAPTDGIEVCVELKLVESETGGKLELHLQCTDASKYHEKKHAETDLIRRISEPDEKVVVKITPSDAGVSLTLVHPAFAIKETQDEPKLIENMQDKAIDSLMGIPPPKAPDPPNCLDDTISKCSNNVPVLKNISPLAEYTDEAPSKHKEVNLDTKADNSVEMLQDVLLPVHLKMDGADKVRVVLGNRDGLIESRTSPTVRPKQETDNPIHLDLIETSPGKFSVLLKATGECLETCVTPHEHLKDTIHPLDETMDLLEEKTQPLKVTLVSVDSTTCLLKIQTQTQINPPESACNNAFEEGAPNRIEAGGPQEAKPSNSSIERNESLYVEQQSNKDMPQDICSACSVISEKHEGESEDIPEQTKTQSQVEKKRECDAKTEGIAVTLSVHENHTVGVHIEDKSHHKFEISSFDPRNDAHLSLQQDTDNQKINTINQVGDL